MLPQANGVSAVTAGPSGHSTPVVPYHTVPSGRRTAAASPGAPTSAAMVANARSSRRCAAGSGVGYVLFGSSVGAGVGTGEGRSVDTTVGLARMLAPGVSTAGG